MKSTASRSIAIVGMAVAAVATTALADSVAGNAPAAVAADGLKVVRDKASGRLRAPNAAELREMEAAEPAAAVPQPLIASRLANGTLTVKLDASHLVQVNASRDAEGRIVTGHADPALGHPGSTTSPASLPTE